MLVCQFVYLAEGQACELHKRLLCSTTSADPCESIFRVLFRALPGDYFLIIRRLLYYCIATPCVCSIVVLSNCELNEIINQMLGIKWLWISFRNLKDEDLVLPLKLCKECDLMLTDVCLKCNLLLSQGLFVIYLQHSHKY